MSSHWKCRVARHCLQAAKKEGKPILQETFKTTSRREIMHLAAASLGFLSLLLPESAEARTRNADIRKKIFEKLEELREKAGLSRPKVEGQEKNPKDEAEAEAGEKNRKPSNEIEGKKPTPQQSTAPSSDGGLPLPLLSLLNGKTVETNLS
ncbi:Uncharacterized protein Adt_08976 [Abeliophyllum distichum]|uniref:Twin-arginine translocation signal domain-containing protein n=1 Tax=Abeliophyllum distichum TaxID=126358 RepID=A0ABD1UFZ5_9LAMI